MTSEVSPLISHHCAINCMEIRQWSLNALFSIATRRNQPDECVYEGPSSKPRLQDRLTSWCFCPQVECFRIVPTTEPWPHAFQTTSRPIIRRYIVRADKGVVKQTINYIKPQIWNIWYGTTSLDTTWTHPMSISTNYFPMTHHSVSFLIFEWPLTKIPPPKFHIHFLSLHLSDMSSPS